jgi:hypothetical protein
MPRDLAAEIERRRDRVVTWFVPVVTPNPLNGSHGHWRVKQARAAEHHEETVTRAPKGIEWTAPLVVVLRRLYCGAPCQLDPRDNLPAALKWVTDGVAEVVGIDDGDEEKFRVQYEQERVPKKSMQGVMVTVIQGARIVETLEFVA